MRRIPSHVRRTLSAVDRAVEQWIGYTLPPPLRALAEARFAAEPPGQACPRCGGPVGAGEVVDPGCSLEAAEADGARASQLEKELRQVRKQVDVLERKLARKNASPLEGFNMDTSAAAGRSDALDSGAALDEAEQMVSHLLEGLDEGRWHPLWDLVDSGENMSRLFARVASGPVIDGQRTGLEVRPSDGATIRFPAGRHALDARTLSRFDPFPREIVIEGAGMDQTLLVMNDDIRPTGQVFHLRIKNATVDTAGGSLIRAGNEAFRSSPASSARRG